MKNVNALDIQIAGSHYKDKEIQPIEFLMKYGRHMDVCQKNMLKYVSRYPEKNGIEDLRKSIHYEQLRRDLKLRQGAFTEEDYLAQFNEDDAMILRLIYTGDTSEASAMIQQMIRDAL